MLDIKNPFVYGNNKQIKQRIIETMTALVEV